MYLKAKNNYIQKYCTEKGISYAAVLESLENNNKSENLLYSLQNVQGFDLK